MAPIDIAFGTLKGGGQPLSEETPFRTLLTLLLVPDSLCAQCLARLKVVDYEPEVFTLGFSQDSNGCRLCVLLLARFRTTATATASVIEIEFWKTFRYGYFNTVFEIVFRTVEAQDGRTNVVSLAIQNAKPDRGVIGVDVDPLMVYFESKISPSTDSKSSMAQVVEWFETCCEEHSCTPQNSPAPFVPSRLLEISGLDEGTMRIRLRERRTLPVDVRYATLSHCWGSVMPFKLKKELLESCLNGISLDEISRVFRDAIRVAWRLKIQYIWIDSLCIIQDSRKDWAAESARMGSVYRHGVLNIAATGFSDGSNGLFVQREPNLLTPISLSMGTNHSSLGNYYLVDTSVWRDGVDNSPLCGRGWVTQERALSVRTVHFGKEQLFWECLCENASEVLPKGMLRGTEIMCPKVFLVPGETKEERTEKLRSIQELILRFRKHDDNLREIMGSDYEDSDNECGSDDDTGDKVFAARMMAIRNGNLGVPDGTMPEKGLSSWSSDSDSDYSNFDWGSYGPNKQSKSTKRKLPKFSVTTLNLSPRRFEDCDINILDGLDIKGWEKFKAQLEEWKIGQHWANSVESRLIRGMPHALKKWVALVKLFSRCSLSFSSDKLIAVSGMARTLAPELNCDYLAGIWRKDLEHQLLWKVTRPRPAPKKDHTRGPSWTWASVDGAIDIPEWSGYFYDGIAGDITWMAKVNGVRVRLAETGQYGYARSGILTLTGRLGVFRIIKNEPENSVDAHGSRWSKRPWIRASWDTQELAENFGGSEPWTFVQRHSSYGTEKGARRSMHPLDIFFAPVRIMDADTDGLDDEQPMLTGLLLLPTGNKKGTFRRVGQFELSGQWHHLYKETFGTLSKSTTLLDDRLYVSRSVKRGEYTIHIV